VHRSLIRALFTRPAPACRLAGLTDEQTGRMLHLRLWWYRSPQTRRPNASERVVGEAERHHC
ncbi:hypothetical protein ACUOJG_27010, partial [Escherichia coli]